MDTLQDYSCVITGNVGNKLNFLSTRTPELQVSVDAVAEFCDVKPNVKTKRNTVDSNSWMRIRPVRRRSSKYLTDDEDSDPDYEPMSPVEEKTISYREPLENIERRLGIPRKPNQYGAIEGVVIGQWWKTRMECSYSGAHRPTVAGIHPGPEGAYSVALSGGYEGDWDVGNEFTFTGEGGRDLKGTKDKPKEDASEHHQYHPCVHFLVPGYPEKFKDNLVQEIAGPFDFVLGIGVSCPSHEVKPLSVERACIF